MEKLTLVKTGGNIIEDPQSLDQLLHNFVQIHGKKILVHGGGKTTNILGAKMGIVPNMIEGRRITDKATLDLVTMIYAGLINKNVVAQLQAKSCQALGLTGADLNSIQSVKRPVAEIDYGWVGDIVKVNTTILRPLLDRYIVPVFCAITHDKHGNLLNTNADTIAATLGAAFAEDFEVHIFYVFEKKGVLLNAEDEMSVIRNLDEISFEQYKKENIIVEGMIPKLKNGFDALKQGVKEVFVCDIAGMLTAQGTMLSLE